MGCSKLDYSNINYALVDENKIKEVEEFFNSLDPKTTGFHGVKFAVEDGELIDIELDDYYREYPDEKLFAEKLREALIEGSIDLFFVDDDDDETRHVEITTDRVFSSRRIDVPDYCRPLYCKNCNTLIGYMGQEEQARLNKLCAECVK